ncbi:hypothetical protein F2Q69_00060043, partial [Brassica cretica]
MQNHKRAFFDSADWALHKLISNIKYSRTCLLYFQRTPRKQLPPRRPTCATGQENLVGRFELLRYNAEWFYY